MDRILFEEWIREVDRRFAKEGPKIVLLVDNCPVHPSFDNLVSTELIFLPLKTTSKLQLMDQAVIPSLKAHYKMMSIKKLIQAIEKKKPLPEFSMFDAMQMLDVAWEGLQAKLLLTVLKSWNFKRKAILSRARKNWISLPYITPISSQKEPPLMISSLRMILSLGLGH